MARPSTSTSVMNGQLGIQAPSTFGTSLVMIASPAAPTAGYGVKFIVTSIAEVKAAFAAPANQIVVDAFTNAFFGQAPEGNTVYVVAMASTTTLSTLAAAANVEKALIPAKGDIRLIAFIKFPDNTYTPTITNGFDQDVHNAVDAVQTLADAWLINKKPFRAFIQGFACDGIKANAKDYSATDNRNCFIVAGELAGNSALATLAALGRAVAAQPQRNIGRIQDGSLNLPNSYSVTLGATNVDNIPDSTFDTYYAKRYITIEPNDHAAGYVFTDDIALTSPTDDYFSLANGRVIDNMVRIADSVYYNELKNDVDVDENGRIDGVEEKALENAITGAIDLQMRSQLSKNADGTAAVSCLVNPDPIAYAALYAANNIASPNVNLLQSGNVYVFVTGRPKGCLRNINIYLGYSLN